MWPLILVLNQLNQGFRHGTKSEECCVYNSAPVRHPSNVQRLDLVHLWAAHSTRTSGQGFGSVHKANVCSHLMTRLTKFSVKMEMQERRGSWLTKARAIRQIFKTIFVHPLLTWSSSESLGLRTHWHITDWHLRLSEDEQMGFAYGNRHIFPRLNKTTHLINDHEIWRNFLTREQITKLRHERETTVSRTSETLARLGHWLLNLWGEIQKRGRTDNEKASPRCPRAI